MIRYARAGDIHVAYRVLSEGAPDILYMPGMFFPIEVLDEDPSYARMLRDLGSMGRLVVFDRRGIGNSDPVLDWDAPIAEQWADDALAVLDAVESHDAFVFGHDQSALAGMALAARAPHRVAGLAVMHARLTDGFDEGLMAAIEDAIAGSVSEELLAATGGDGANESAFERFMNRAGRLGASPAVARRLWRAALTAPVVQYGSLVRSPMLVLQRVGALQAPIEAARVGVGNFPTARLVELPGTEILPFLGNLDSVVSELGSFITGERWIPAQSRILATVVFTDLVESTALAGSVGDEAWRELLERHDEITKRLLDRCFGEWVKSTGDGTLALFGTPSDALQFATALRDELHSIDLTVRVGVHAGEIERRGDDVAGVAVHVAARVLGCAAAGEVLVSPAVPMLVAGSALRFESRGAHELRGVDSQWELFALA